MPDPVRAVALDPPGCRASNWTRLSLSLVGRGCRGTGRVCHRHGSGSFTSKHVINWPWFHWTANRLGRCWHAGCRRLGGRCRHPLGRAAARKANCRWPSSSRRCSMSARLNHHDRLIVSSSHSSIARRYCSSACFHADLSAAGFGAGGQRDARWTSGRSRAAGADP